MKKSQKILGIILLGLILVGCGNKTTEDVSAGETATDEAGSTEETPVDEAPPHEHTYAYISNADATHSIVCSGTGCEYAEKEKCVLDENYQCVQCGYKHEHELMAATNNDGTHMNTCNSCEYEESVACTPDESYTCTDCGWIQEHDCVYEHYECQICGSAYPWEQDIKYFDGTFGWSQGIYYAQKELNIYKHPDVESEVVGTLSVNEAISCVGRIIVKDGSDVSNFWITEDGRCILNEFHLSSNRRDLRVGKTNQVVVTYSTLSGNTWSSAKFHAVYDSFDAALQDLCGNSWSSIRENWHYTDYQSQGQPFMNCYSEGASGKTVATRNLVDPYSYSVVGENIDYYFE